MKLPSKQRAPRGRDTLQDHAQGAAGRVTSKSRSHIANGGDGDRTALGGDASDRYPGGKSGAGTLQWLLALMPSHALHVEPFAGKGALVRHGPPALATLVFDKDPAVIRWWHSLGWPGVIARRGDGILWLEKNGPRLEADCLVYLDPPYLLRTRRKKKIYRYEMDDLQHRRLLRAALATSCPVMLSGYASTMYDKAMSSWFSFTHVAVTRGGTLREEVCWTNYDPSAASPALALRYQGLGRDFREREKVARRVKTWTTRLTAMPAAERRAVALAVLDAYRSSIAAECEGDVEQQEAAIVAAASGRTAIESHRGGPRWGPVDLFGGVQ